MKPLANSEYAVMDLLWREAPLTSREIREKLYPDSEKKQHGTVHRLLQRLEDKELVEADRSSHSHTFTARLTREDYASSQLLQITDGLSDSAIAPLLTSFIEDRNIPKKEIQRLREFLDKIDKKARPDD